MKRWSPAFTMIELLIVIVIIGILSTLTIVTYANYQKQARDTQRQTTIESLADALEDYYSKNGEYPSCPEMTGSAASVGKLLNVSQSALVSPDAPAGTTNSLHCGQISYSSPGDPYGYIGDGSTACLSGTSCLSWTLEYRDEQTQQIVSVSSHHQENVATSGNILTLAASNTSYTSTTLTWPSISNATSYQLQYATNNAFTQNVVNTTTTGTSMAISTLTSGVAYYFRVLPISSTSSGNWSNVVQVVTLLATPANNAVSATSATTFAQTWSANPNATSYNVRCSPDNSSWSGCTASTTNTSFSYSGAAQGHPWYVQVQAATASTTSPWSASASTVTPINQPGAPTWLGSTYWQASTQGGPYYYYQDNYGTSCPGGTSVVNGNFTSVYTNDGGTFHHPFGFSQDYWYLPWNQSTTLVDYYAAYQCATSWATSPLSPTTETTVTVHS